MLLKFYCNGGDGMLKRMRSIMTSICLVDIMLVLYMLVLLCYLTVHLFTGIEPEKESNTIDIIVRTSAAAVFGYFISRNFGRKAGGSVTGTVSAVSRQKIDAGTGQIGFRAQLASESEEIVQNDADMLVTDTTEQLQSSVCCDRIQVVVVSIIGLFSLIVLLVARQFPSTAAEYTAIVSQLRDFLSASIGFLISCRNRLSG